MNTDIKGHLTLVGCGLGPDDLTSRHLHAVSSADVLVGGERLLDWFPEFGGEKITIRSHPDKLVTDIVEMVRNQRVAVVASGDSLFFGIGRLFLKAVHAEAITILPNITAAQAALARLRIPWESARFFSVHGRAHVLPWPVVLLGNPSVIYCDSKRNPSNVAQELVNRYPEAAQRHGAIVEDLGGQEKITEGTLAALSAVKTGNLAMLVVFRAPEDQPMTTPPLQLGLADNTYDHEAGLITHAEVRAVALSKLRLGPGVMWDIGAGSGSVGIEACGLCEGLKVYAVEAKPERCRQIEKNACQAGCPSLYVVNGSILQMIDNLPAPRSVFVGGGAREVKEIVNTAFKALIPGGRLVAAAVLLETKSTLLQALPDSQTEVIEVGIKRAVTVGAGHMLKPENPVTLFVLKKSAP